MRDGHKRWMRGMFDSASDRYILLNTLMTFGMDELWRRRASEAVIHKDNGKILDICAGPGDLTLKIAARFPDQAVYGLDYSTRMLKRCRERARLSRRGNLILTNGDCGRLPFGPGVFDHVTVSFGFRNLSYSHDTLREALGEVRRVLKDGGRFIIIETNQPPNTLIRRLFHFYARRIVPLAGSLFAPEKKAYRYLANSMVKFYGKEGLVDLMKSSGFEEERLTPFIFGAILLSIFKKRTAAAIP